MPDDSNKKWRPHQPGRETSRRLMTGCALLLVWVLPGPGQGGAHAAEALKSGPLPMQFLLTAPAPPPTGGPAVLHIGYDRLHGNPVALSTNAGTLVWQANAAFSPVAFPLSEVDRITFQRPTAVAKSRTPHSRLYFTNGNRLTGTILELNAESLQIAPAFGDPLRIPRHMLERIVSLQTEALTLYEGPDALKHWTGQSAMPGTSWRLKNGALLATKTDPIGRTLTNLPDRVDFEFDAAWRDQPDFTFMFFSEDVRNNIAPGYAIMFAGDNATLRRADASIRISVVGTAPLEGLTAKRRATVNVLVDRNERRIQVLIDGEPAAQWADELGVPSQAGGIGFSAGPRSGALKIENIRVARWSGRLPTAATPSTRIEADELFLINDDRITGALYDMTNGIAHLQLPDGNRIDIPASRISEIVLGGLQRFQAYREPADVTATLANRQGTLTFTILDWQDEVLTASSENFGIARIPTGALASLNFRAGAAGSAASQNLLMDKVQCLSRQRLITAAIQAWAKGRPAAAPPTPEDLAPWLHDGLSVMRCPAGGRYQLDASGVRCSISGHASP